MVGELRTHRKASINPISRELYRFITTVQWHRNTSWLYRDRIASFHEWTHISVRLEIHPVCNLNGHLRSIAHLFYYRAFRRDAFTYRSDAVPVRIRIRVCVRFAFARGEARLKFVNETFHVTTSRPAWPSRRALPAQNWRWREETRTEHKQVSTYRPGLCLRTHNRYKMRIYSVKCATEVPVSQCKTSEPAKLQSFR